MLSISDSIKNRQRMRDVTCRFLKSFEAHKRAAGSKVEYFNGGTWKLKCSGANLEWPLKVLQFLALPFPAMEVNMLTHGVP